MLVESSSLLDLSADASLHVNGNLSLNNASLVLDPSPNSSLLTVSGCLNANHATLRLKNVSYTPGSKVIVARGFDATCLSLFDKVVVEGQEDACVEGEQEMYSPFSPLDRCRFYSESPLGSSNTTLAVVFSSIQECDSSEPFPGFLIVVIVVPIALVAVIATSVVFLVPSIRKKIVPHRGRSYFRPGE